MSLATLSEAAGADIRVNGATEVKKILEVAASIAVQ
jgi:hypothetical protein